MNAEADKFWADLTKQVCRANGLHSLTPAEAEQELGTVKPEPLSDDRIKSIIDVVLSGDLTDWSPPAQPNLDPALDTYEVRDDVRQLNRNEGDEDSETDELMDEHRRRALGDNDGQEEQNGMDGGAGPVGEGV